MDAWFVSKGLHICHLNVHYLYPKLDEIKLLLHEQNSMDIFCLGETFLNDQYSDSELTIPNYNFIRKDRGSNGGGLIIYYKTNLACIHRVDLESDNLEMLWLEVRNNKQKPFLICYVYRPPSATRDWTDQVEQSLEKGNYENKEILFLGDLNFNMLNKTGPVKAWLQKMDNLHLSQLVSSPTRVTDTSETIIDHVYSNFPDNITSITVPHYSISDHYPVCVTRKISNAFDKGPVHKFINYRDTKSFNESDFINELEEQPWTVLNIFDTASDALDYFISTFNLVLNKHAPKKKRRVKKSKQPNWMNQNIMAARKTRDSIDKSKNMAEYRVWRNRSTGLIQNAKKEFYSQSINDNYKNPKCLWQNLHDVTNKSSKQQTTFIHDDNGDPILDPEATADKFNEFFTSLYKDLNSNGKKSTDINCTKLQDFVGNKVPDGTEFEIPLVSASFIHQQLQNLKANKATGIDDISAKYLKLSASVISQPLATILNLSISSGIYPDDLKKAKVTPIFKKGEKQDINNYRPVSVLPVITGIFERHISTCLINFLDKHKLIYDNQSGFRRNHSCQTSLTKMVDNWFTAMNNNEIVGAVLLDLSKAFDLVSHQILKQKLSAYKFSHLSQRWFDSYLSNRFQQVQISGKLSESKEIKAGVPQGSVLGPLLFLLYINDLPLYIKHCLLDLFADDGTLHTSNTYLPSVTTLLNTDLENFSDWCDDNDMKKNTSKSKAMFLATRYTANKIMEEPPNIAIRGEQIEISETEKLLGVHIDNSLSWSSHIESTLKKCNSLLFLLNRIKQYLNVSTRKLFYNAYILPHLDYCCSIWGNANSELMSAVIKFQKRAARSILDKPMETPSVELFTELKWMMFPERVRYQKAILMYKIMHNLTPPYLSNIFKFSSEVHNRALRSTTENLLYVPKPNIEIYRKSLAYSGSKIWNSIPEQIRNANSLQQFRKRYLEWAANEDHSSL